MTEITDRNSCDGSKEENEQIFLRDYYKLQWERIAHHEDQRLRFSGIISAGSIAGIGLLVRFSENIDPSNLTIGYLVIIATNLLGIIFASKSRDWVKHHQNKSKEISEKIGGCMKSILDEIEKPDSDNDPFRRELIFRHLHLLLRRYYCL